MKYYNIQTKRREINIMCTTTTSYINTKKLNNHCDYVLRRNRYRKTESELGQFSLAMTESEIVLYHDVLSIEYHKEVTSRSNFSDIMDEIFLSEELRRVDNVIERIELGMKKIPNFIN